MFSEIMSMMADSITFCFNTFMTFVSDSWQTLLFSMFVIGIVVRFLLLPIIGGRGSDSVSADDVERTRQKFNEYYNKGYYKR